MCLIPAYPGQLVPGRAANGPTADLLPGRTWSQIGCQSGRSLQRVILMMIFMCCILNNHILNNSIIIRNHLLRGRGRSSSTQTAAPGDRSRIVLARTRLQAGCDRRRSHKLGLISAPARRWHCGAAWRGMACPCVPATPLRRPAGACLARPAPLGGPPNLTAECPAVPRARNNRHLK